MSLVFWSPRRASLCILMLSAIAAGNVFLVVVVAFAPPSPPCPCFVRHIISQRQKQGVSTTSSLIKPLYASTFELVDDDDDEEELDDLGKIQLDEDEDDDDDDDEDPYTILASSEFQDSSEDNSSSSSSALTTTTNNNNDNIPTTAVDWGGALGKLRQRVQDVETGKSQDPSWVLFRTMSSETPNQVIGQFITQASPQVVSAMSGAVSTLLGGLSNPSTGVETIVKASGEKIGNLCFQLQMTGYVM
jgi:hypothetical protein